MRVLIPFSILIIMLISCGDEDDSVFVSSGTDQENLFSIEIFIHQCKTIRCGEEIPLDQIEVEIYKTKEDALTGRDVFRSVTSDTSGIVILNSLSLSEIFIKVETEDFGTYISKEAISGNVVKVFHDIRFVKGYVYHEDDRAILSQKHISLSNPAVGQESDYLYHLTYSHISFTPVEYSDIGLNVRIVDQLDSNIFIVKETIDTIIEILAFATYPSQEVVTSMWRFENDSLHITPYENNYFGSFAWNISGDFITREANGYCFSLERPAFNGLDMDIDLQISNIRWWGVGYAEDYNLFGRDYNDLITDVIGYTSFDGPLKLRVYNLDDGLVRSLDFFSGMSLSTHGFDLVLE